MVRPSPVMVLKTARNGSKIIDKNAEIAELSEKICRNPCDGAK
jgi:hypothetical protein